MRLLVAQRVDEDASDLIMRKAGAAFDIDFLASADKESRKHLLENADVILAMNFRRDIFEEEVPLIKKAKLIQITLAGADMVPYAKLSPGIVICSNGGAYSEPIAEHAIGMMLALARSFLPLHDGLSRGEFDQSTKHKMLNGSTLGIIGFGGIGRRVAGIARAFGMTILAINSTGRTEREVDFSGTLKDLDHVLQESDFVLLTIALNKYTRDLIGAKELNLMKEDAVLVNVARGDLIDEKDLYEHLKSHPHFRAGIDAWWVEPFNQPKFEIHSPFFELDNFLGSPHNSYLIKGIRRKALEAAVDNILRFADGRELKNVQKRENYL